MGYFVAFKLLRAAVYKYRPTLVAGKKIENHDQTWPECSSVELLLVKNNYFNVLLGHNTWLKTRP